MFKKLVIAILVLASIPALADSWDSDSNINKAMDRAVSIYKNNGVAGLVVESKNCYAGLDGARTNKNLGRDLEYCISLEMASTLIDRDTSGGDKSLRNPYFNGVIIRSVYQLEKARITTLPEHVDAYLSQRFTKIEKELPGKM